MLLIFCEFNICQRLQSYIYIYCECGAILQCYLPVINVFFYYFALCIQTHLRHGWRLHFFPISEMYEYVMCVKVKIKQ